VSATGVPHLERACELLWQHGHPAIGDALEREVSALAAALAEANENRMFASQMITDYREGKERAEAELERVRAALRDGVEANASCGCSGWIRPFAGDSTFVTAFNCSEHEVARRYYFTPVLAGGARAAQEDK
jgi:hypothetical protein